ncbi:MAG TPA: DUF6580 family putative transport protein [Candidatus Limnocylindria bacterium]|nr:DUF6580 family putative transport protein [Candidatus Limnocylindria bacterium]
MKARCHQLLPYVFLLLVALSRWPGLMPVNFSAVYALVFCAGAFFPPSLSWRAPFAMLLVTDLVLNCFYQFVRGYEVFTVSGLMYQVCNYGGFAVLWWLGRRFRGTRNLLGLLGGGMLGAILFYLVTNTTAWLLNPFHNVEYTKTFAGWLTALTLGTKGWPQTWEFFRNTLLSGGLFTLLFGAAWQLTTSESPAEKGEPAAEEAASESEPEEAQA